ncbi:MAG: hypothetical protein RI554_02260 [Trueperaceae bacterium]|nr:hypothetical protein [Trueperaceae bacterium]
MPPRRPTSPPPHPVRDRRPRAPGIPVAFALAMALAALVGCGGLPPTESVADAPLRVAAGTTQRTSLDVASLPDGAVVRPETSSPDLTVEVERADRTTLDLILRATPDAIPARDDVVVAAFADAEATTPLARYRVDVDVLGRYVLQGNLVRDDLTAGRALAHRGDLATSDEYVVLIDADGDVLADDVVDGDGRFRLDVLLDASTLDAAPPVALLRARAAHAAETVASDAPYVCLEPIGVADAEVDADGLLRTRATRPLLVDYRPGRSDGGVDRRTATPADDAFDDRQWPRVVDLGDLRKSDHDGGMTVHDAEAGALTAVPANDGPFVDAEGRFRPSLLACGAPDRTSTSLDVDLTFDLAERILDAPAGGPPAWVEQRLATLGDAPFASALLLDLEGGVDGAAHAAGDLAVTRVSSTEPDVTRYAASTRLRKPLAVADPSTVPDLLEVDPVITDSCYAHPATCDFAAGVTPVVDLGRVTAESTANGRTVGSVDVALDVALDVVTVVGRADVNGVAAREVHASCADGPYAHAQPDTDGTYVMRLLAPSTTPSLRCTFSLGDAVTLDDPVRTLPADAGVVVLDDLWGWAR